MPKNLLIVESPAKANTIEKYLGKDYTVKSCFGHIRDLSHEKMGIDISNNYEPNYIIQEDKQKVINELKKTSNNSDEVWLATDEDREGEAISWHLCEALKLDPNKTKRIAFHEITKKAITEAIKKPRKVDTNLVNAQQARRILDRIVGFRLSPLLRKKLTYGQTLSAGRVQSVAVRIIVEREEEIKKFPTQFSYKVEATFEEEQSNKKYIFTAKAKDITAENDANTYLESCKEASYLVKDITTKETRRRPAAPFSTSTLQQEASQRLGYNVSRTMVVAQQLYEQGFITYMRTDSNNLSNYSMNEIKEFITTQFSDKYYERRVYKNKSSSAQEAHEAIRPTNVFVDKVPDSLQSLYSLIRKRTIASQMSDAIFDKTNISIEISTNKDTLSASGEVIKFDGFLSVYDSNKSDNDTSKLPKLSIGQKLHFLEMSATQKFKKAPSRYNEASLVKKLEELGIGRPSTYAPTITTIQKRGYVEKKDTEGNKREYIKLTLNNKSNIVKKTLDEMAGGEKNKLFPTDIGVLVNTFLLSKFNDIINYQFTSQIESAFDKIANGELVWNQMIDSFYVPFDQKIEEVKKDKELFSMERELGIDPKTGKKVIVRMGAYGPLVQLGESKDKNSDDKPKYSKLQPNQNIDTITFEEAMSLFNLPRNVGVYEDEELIANIGRYGPYVLHNKTFYSIPKELSPHTISLKEAIEIIEIKREADKKKNIKIFEAEEISILNGRYGPYIKHNSSNYKLPKEFKDNPENLSLAEVQEIIKNSKTKKTKYTRKKK